MLTVAANVALTEKPRIKSFHPKVHPDIRATPDSDLVYDVKDVMGKTKKGEETDWR